jgi:myosin heavy subunit
MKCRYEAELSRAEQKYAEKLEIVVADGKAHLEEVHSEHAAALTRLQADTFQREAELRQRLAGVEEEYSTLKTQSQKPMESMHKDKNTKLQVAAGRWKELEDEVDSLQTVLDLRHKQLQELRKQNEILTREAEDLPAALKRVSALGAKAEDLQVQLNLKNSIVKQLSHDNSLLMESLHRESKQSKRLSLHNEELQWKLKQNFEVALAALSGGSVSTSLTGSLQTPPTSGRSVHSSAQSLTNTDTSTAGNQLFTNRISPCTSSASRSCISAASDVSADPATVGCSVLSEDIDMSPPASIKVKAEVEKSDSVSWVVEFVETPEALLSRLVRQTGDFRSTVPPTASVPSPARAKTLPPPKRQQHKASSLCLSSSATAIARPVAGSQ